MICPVCGYEKYPPTKMFKVSHPVHHGFRILAPTRTIGVERIAREALAKARAVRLEREKKRGLD